MADMHVTCHVFDFYLQFLGHSFRLYTYKQCGQKQWGGGCGSGL